MIEEQPLFVVLDTMEMDNAARAAARMQPTRPGHTGEPCLCQEVVMVCM